MTNFYQEVPKKFKGGRRVPRRLRHRANCDGPSYIVDVLPTCQDCGVQLAEVMCWPRAAGKLRTGSLPRYVCYEDFMSRFSWGATWGPPLYNSSLLVPVEALRKYMPQSSLESEDGSYSEAGKDGLPS